MQIRYTNRSQKRTGQILEAIIGAMMALGESYLTKRITPQNPIPHLMESITLFNKRIT